MDEKEGFTLIELVFVIVLLGILAAVALPKFFNITSQAQTAAAAGIKGALSSAVNLAHVQWLAMGSSETIQLSNNTIVMSTQGWPEATTGKANGRTTARKCLQVWNGILDAPPPANNGTCAGNCKYLVKVTKSPVCEYINNQGQGPNTISYDIATGIVTLY